MSSKIVSKEIYKAFGNFWIFPTHKLFWSGCGIDVKTINLVLVYGVAPPQPILDEV